MADSSAYVPPDGGLAQLIELMNDPYVSEIMINGPDLVFVEREGKITRTDIRFRGPEEITDFLKKISSPAGGQEWGDPIVSARMKDGSRVHAVFSPVIIGSGPSITIRRFLASKLSLKSLVQSQSLSEEMAYFLSACVQARLNIVVSGGTSSGKTSMLNALSTVIDPNDRIVTIEDTAELKLKAQNIVKMECQVAQGHRVTLRELLQSALRMRPDRIIVGETRGPECFDMLQAMNTGHEGSMTTIHANSPRDCLYRIESMSLIANSGIPLEALRRQIASAIDILIHVQKRRDGSRKVISISEVGGMEGNTILTQEIFQFIDLGEASDRSLLGKFTATGIVPRSMKAFKDKGIGFPKDFFAGSYHVNMERETGSQLPARRVKERK